MHEISGVVLKYVSFSLTVFRKYRVDKLEENVKMQNRASCLVLLFVDLSSSVAGLYSGKV